MCHSFLGCFKKLPDWHYPRRVRQLECRVADLEEKLARLEPFKSMYRSPVRTFSMNTSCSSTIAGGDSCWSLQSEGFTTADASQQGRTSTPEQGEQQVLPLDIKLPDLGKHAVGELRDRICSFFIKFERVRLEQDRDLSRSANAPGDCEDSDEEEAGAYDDIRFHVDLNARCPEFLMAPSPVRSSRVSRMIGCDRILFADASKHAPIKFYFLGRSWHLFHWHKNTFMYFAERSDLEELPPPHSALDLSNLLVPLQPNLDMRLLKYNHRLHLSFSATFPVIQCQVNEIPDLKSSTVPNRLLTDGCGLISPSLMMVVQAKLDLATMPSAIQARCGSFKGVWCIDHGLVGDVLCARPSQQKYQSDLQRCPADSWHELEVLRCSKDSGPGTLNSETIQALEGRGVPVSTFKELQQEAWQCCIDEFRDIVGFQRYLSCIPKGGIVQELYRLFLAGVPWDEYHYVKLRERQLGLIRSQITERLRLPVKHSRRVFLIPDFTQTLRHGEVYYRCSSQEVRLGDVQEVVVLRNPSYHPSNVLRACIPDTKHLDPRLLKMVDVLVLGACENEEIASPAKTLCDADFDGDDALIIWDLRIVEKVGDMNLIEEGSIETKVESAEWTLGGSIPKPDNGPEVFGQCLLDSYIQVIDEHCKFCRAAKMLKASTDCALDEHQSEPTTGAASYYSVCFWGVNCLVSGVSLPLSERSGASEQAPWPHWMRPKRFQYRSTTACGILFDGTSELVHVELPSGRATLSSLLNRWVVQLDRSILEQVREEAARYIAERQRRRKRKGLSMGFKKQWESQHRQEAKQKAAQEPSEVAELLAAAAYKLFENKLADTEDTAARLHEEVEKSIEVGNKIANDKKLSLYDVEDFVWDVHGDRLCRMCADTEGKDLAVAVSSEKLPMVKIRRPKPYK